MIAAFLEKYRALVLLFTGGLVVTAGDPVMKKWILNGGYVNYLVGLAIWTVGLNFLAFSFSSKNMASASVIFIIFNVITLTLVGYFAFRERLKTKEILGIVLGLISIFILEMAE